MAMLPKGILPSGSTYEELEGEKAEKYKRLWFLFQDGCIKVQPWNRVYSKYLLKFADLWYNFKVWRNRFCCSTLACQLAAVAHFICLNLYN